MKSLFLIFFFSLLGFSQNQAIVDIVTLKQLDNNDIALYIHKRPDSLANKGIQIEINVFESDFEIKSKKGYKNRYKKFVDNTKGDYDHFSMITNDGIITTQISPITSKYYKLEVILFFPDGTKKTESKILKINDEI